MPLKGKIFVVVNPAAGGGLGRYHWRRISEELRKRAGAFEYEETTSISHGRVLAFDAARAGNTVIIAYGGDGTIHEVVNGIQDSGASPKPALGILCVGTGGDLIKTLGIPKKMPDQLRILLANKRRLIDLGRVEYTNIEGKREERTFINIVDAGVGAEVVRSLRRSRNFFGRKIAYLTSTLGSYLKWDPREIQITTDHPDRLENRAGWPRRFLSVVIANGRYFGGGMPIAPTADLSDGFFDLVTVGEMGPIKALLAVPLLYSRQMVRLPNVHTDRAKRISLISERRVDLDIDGEPIGSLPATFEILPAALEVIAP